MSRLYGVSSLMTLLSYSFLISACVTDEWPRYMHDNANSGYNPCVTTITKANVASLHQIGAAGPNGVQGSVVVKNGVVYYGDGAGILYAKNLDLSADVYPPVTLPGGFPINNTVLVTDTTVYVCSGSPNPYPTLYAFNLDLTPQASFAGGSVQIDPTVAAGTQDAVGSPVLADNVVIIATAGTDQETNINPNFHGSINAFNIADGSLAWRFTISPAPFISGGSFSTPAVDTNLKMIFIGTSQSQILPANNLTDALLAINYQTGQLVWSYQYLANDAYGALYPEGADADVGASPNLFQVRRVSTLCNFGATSDLVDAVGVANKQGTYRVFERATGKLLWTSNVLSPTDHFTNQTAPGAAFIPGSSALSNGTVYVPALLNNSGIRLNVVTLLGLNGNAAASAQSFITNFSTTMTRIAAFDVNSGALKWNDTSVSTTSGSLTAANGMIFHNNWLGQLRVLDADTGALLTSLTVASPVGITSLLPAPITIAEGNLYISTGISGLPGGVLVYSV